MQVLSDKELREKFGITPEQIDQWEQDIQNGIFHGEPGELICHRPLTEDEQDQIDRIWDEYDREQREKEKTAEQTQTLGFKEPLSTVEAIDARAEQLGMHRSDYLHHLVEQDLKLAGAL